MARGFDGAMTVDVGAITAHVVAIKSLEVAFTRRGAARSTHSVAISRDLGADRTLGVEIACLRPRRTALDALIPRLEGLLRGDEAPIRIHDATVIGLEVVVAPSRNCASRIEFAHRTSSCAKD